MDIYRVKPMKRNSVVTVSVPGSKSITNRSLLMASLAKGTSYLKGVLFSDDSRYFLSCLESLGFKINIDEENAAVSVEGCDGNIPNKEAEIYVGSAGTAARFLTCMCGLSSGTYVINASEQMKRRPMKPLMDALINLGAKIEYIEQEDHLPIKITGCGGIEGRKKVELDISSSTQFLSALLMTSVMLKDGLDIIITSNKKFGSYIGITMKMMEQFGLKVEFDGENYHTKAKAEYEAKEYQIEPDISAACYFFAMAAVTSSSIKVLNVSRDSMQGDIRFLEVLEKMGCSVSFAIDGVVVEGPEGNLKGIEVDMNNFSDQAMTLAAIAILADSDTKITGIGHIRLQESDRLSAIVNELTRLGIENEHGDDWVIIHPGAPIPAEIETYEDHRMAMAFTLVGLVYNGIAIKNPMCCRKTFENYFDIIDEICN